MGGVNRVEKGVRENRERERGVSSLTTQLFFFSSQIVIIGREHGVSFEMKK